MPGRPPHRRPGPASAAAPAASGPRPRPVIGGATDRGRAAAVGESRRALATRRGMDLCGPRRSRVRGRPRAAGHRRRTRELGVRRPRLRRLLDPRTGGRRRDRAQAAREPGGADRVRPRLGAGWAALFYNSDWIPVFGLLALLLLLFPDGRPPGPRWRLAVWLAVGAPVLMAVIAAFRDEPFDDPYADVARPLPALPEGVDAVLSAVGLSALLAAVALAAMAMIVRLRRSRGVERIQIK